MAHSQANEMLIKQAISHKTSFVVQVLLPRPIVSRIKFVSLLVVTAITAQWNKRKDVSIFLYTPKCSNI